MADADQFDPRFDPAYQRGFEGEAEPMPRAATVAPAARPAVEQPLEVIERTPERAPAERSRRAAPEPDEDAAGSRRNPFFIAVLIIAGLLILGGVLIFVRLPEWRAEVQGAAVVDYSTLEALQFGAPLMIALGIGTVIAVLLQAAKRWGRSDD
jgi:hypothetical protein